MAGKKPTEELEDYAGGWITERKGTGIPAFFKLTNPIMAAVAMLLSSASVVGNTMRLTRDDVLAVSGRD
jgi:hypothetical protein